MTEFALNLTEKLKAPRNSTIYEGFSDCDKGLLTLFLICIILGILFGNGLVVGIFYQYKPLRNVTNYFIMSLALADILVGVLSIPIWIAYIHYDLFADAHGTEVYRIWLCIDILSGVSSVLSLTLISIDRYVRITMGLHYHRLFTSKRARFMIAFIWSYAASLAVTKAVFYDWRRPNYEILIFIMGFGLPFAIMGACHYKIFKAAKFQAKKLREQNLGSINEQRHELKARVVLVVILAFLLSWSPFFLVNLSYGLCPNCKIPGAVITISKWLHYSNSFFNPIIYTLMNKEFRSAFYTLLSRRRFNMNTKKAFVRFPEENVKMQANGSIISITSMSHVKSIVVIASNNLRSGNDETSV